MTPDLVSTKTVTAKVALIVRADTEIAELPLTSVQAFSAERRSVNAGESCLRRSLEALMDLGRHILAKGFGEAVPEYSGIGPALARHGVLGAATAERLAVMARYRNRLVHFYDEITDAELFGILTGRRGEILSAADEMRRWLSEHPEQVRDDL